jgi:hypothetical protein
MSKGSIPIAAPVLASVATSYVLPRAIPEPHSSTFLLHDGEHKVDLAQASDAVSTIVENQHSGHVYERTLGVSDIKEICPEGFPEPLQIPSAFYHELLTKGLESEMKSTSVELNPGVTITCHSDETVTEAFRINIAIAIGSGMFARRWEITLELPLKEMATSDKTHQIALRAVRQDFQKEIARLETKMRLMQLQLNQRVFFGVNHSVHMDVQRLVMAQQSITKPTPVSIEACAHAAKGKSFGLKGCNCPTNCKCYERCNTVSDRCKIIHWMPISEVASKNSVESAINTIAASQESHTKDTNKALFATETEMLLPLPSSALAPLALCHLLAHLELSGVAFFPIHNKGLSTRSIYTHQTDSDRFLFLCTI